MKSKIISQNWGLSKNSLLVTIRYRHARKVLNRLLIRNSPYFIASLGYNKE